MLVCLLDEKHSSLPSTVNYSSMRSSRSHWFAFRVDGRQSGSCTTEELAPSIKFRDSLESDSNFPLRLTMGAWSPRDASPMAAGNSVLLTVSMRSYAPDCYGRAVQAHWSEIEFTQWRPLEKITSAILNRVCPGSLRPTSILAFFHFPGGAVAAIGVLFAFSNMLCPTAHHRHRKQHRHPQLEPKTFHLDSKSI
jgi:hypothetical protein